MADEALHNYLTVRDVGEQMCVKSIFPQTSSH